ncbi:MAG: heme ABC transporter ATP-binding protein [Bacteroidota bacterium]
MLVADHVSVRLGRSTLLDDVSVHLAPGEVLAVVGANGAGKTTLMRLLSGEQTPTEGTVRLGETPLDQFSADDLARCRGVLPQHASLAFGFTVEEVVLLGRTPHRTRATEDDEIARAALHAAGVHHLLGRSYPTLSGGEQQRVHLARTLAQIWEAPSPPSPRYLLLDEPTASLDLAHQHAVLRTARRCAQADVGVLAVLHDLNLAAQYAHRIAVLKHGQLVAEGPPATVLTPEVIQHAFDVAVLITDHPRADCPLVVPVPEDTPSGAWSASLSSPLSNESTHA